MNENMVRNSLGRSRSGSQSSWHRPQCFLSNQARISGWITADDEENYELDRRHALCPPMLWTLFFLRAQGSYWLPNQHMRWVKTTSGDAESFGLMASSSSRNVSKISFSYAEDEHVRADDSKRFVGWTDGLFSVQIE
jgi:hypothetical protein